MECKVCIIATQPKHVVGTQINHLYEMVLLSSNTMKKNIGTTGLPQSGKTFWKIKKNPGHGKVREFHSQSGKFRKNEKNHGKVRENQSFPKKVAS